MAAALRKRNGANMGWKAGASIGIAWEGEMEENPESFLFERLHGTNDYYYSCSNNL